MKIVRLTYLISELQRLAEGCLYMQDAESETEFWIFISDSGKCEVKSNKYSSDTFDSLRTTNNTCDNLQLALGQISKIIDENMRF